MQSFPSLVKYVAPIAAALVVACSESGAPTAASDITATSADLSLHSMHMSSATTAAASLAPFTFRAPLDPFKIAQHPDFAIRSKETRDIVIQQSVFAPGAGPWHTHPGPSFIYVVQGRIKLERVLKRGECVETPEYTVGQAYYEIGEQVHRAVVTSAESAVVLVVRFNIPVGAAFTIPAADPGC
jgi:quercetin dioxygenase-like cupin family protein